MKKNALELFDLNRLKSLSNNIIEKTEKHYKGVFLNVFKEACKRPVRKDNIKNNFLLNSLQNLKKGQTIISKKNKSIIPTKSAEGEDGNKYNILI